MRLFRDLLGDMRHAARTVTHYPGFAAATVITLSVVIGANATVFSAVNAILLRPLPYPDADRLVRLVENVPAAESPSGRAERLSTMSPRVFEDWRSQTRTLSHMAIHQPVAVTLRGGGDAVRLAGWRVSPAMLPMFEVRPLVGRLFVEDDERGAPVVLLSEAVWAARFDRDPAVVGRRISLDRAVHTVIGVLPGSFAPFDGAADVWLPFRPDDSGGIFRIAVLARIREGVPLADAQADADRATVAALGVPARAETGASFPRVEIVRWQDELTAPVRRSLPMLMTAVTLVLLIGCVNVGNLFTAHAVRRRHEMAIRAALGAGRWRLIRQVFGESLTLATLGGIGGCAVAAAGIWGMTRMGAGLGRTDLVASVALPRVDEVGVDAAVLAYIAGVAGLVAFTCSLGAMWRLRRPGAALASSPAEVLPGVPAAPLLIAAQAALTVVLLVGSLLLLRSFSRLTAVDPGYDAGAVLTFQLAPPDAATAMEFVAPQARQLEAARNVVARLRTLPGVDDAAFTSGWPMVAGRYMVSLQTDASPAATPIEDGRALLVSRDYFRVMRTRIVRGRGFTPGDEQRTEATFVVNETMARRFFGQADPIGRRLRMWGIAGSVVGVVRDTHATTLDVAPEPQIFMTPFASRHFLPIFNDGLYVTVRTSRADAVAAATPALAREMAPGAAVQRMAMMDEIVAGSMKTQRDYATIVGILAAAALTLVAVGMYAVIACVIGQRRRDIAIRMAVGASRRDVLRLVAGQGLVAVLAGVGVGVGAAWVIAPALRGLLFGVRPLDAVTFASAPALLVLAAVAASALAARNALRVEPMTILRSE